MPRKIVPTVTGETYHVYNRGVEERTIFSDTEDYLRWYQSLLLFNKKEPAVNFSFATSHASSSAERLVQIEAYCLLPNHFHLIVKQLIDGGLSEFMKRISGGYTSYFNEKYYRSGALFQGTYKKVHIENSEQYNYFLAYVNENHFVHNISRGNDIYYSSSLHYQGVSISKLLPVKEQPYDLAQNVELAKSIYAKRLTQKEKLLED